MAYADLLRSQNYFFGGGGGPIAALRQRLMANAPAAFSGGAPPQLAAQAPNIFGQPMPGMVQPQLPPQGGGAPSQQPFLPPGMAQPQLPQQQPAFGMPGMVQPQLPSQPQSFAPLANLGFQGSNRFGY